LVLVELVFQLVLVMLAVRHHLEQLLLPVAVEV
jgi:hypothetical protein